MQDSGDLYSWGMNKDGQLGLGDEASRCSPVLVDSPLVEDCEWSKVSCSKNAAQNVVSAVEDHCMSPVFFSITAWSPTIEEQT